MNKKLTRLCLEILNKARTTTTSSADCFEAGHAKFRIFEAQPLVAPWAKRHFQGAQATQDISEIYLTCTGLFAKQTADLFDGLWYQQTINEFAGIGMYGYYDKETEQLEFFDPAQNIGVRVLRDLDATPPWEISTPVVNFVNWMNTSRDATMIHGATLATENHGALLVGPGGSGKSLLTLGGVNIGMRTIGDDYAIVSCADPKTYSALPYSAMAKQTPKGLKLLGEKGKTYTSAPQNWQDKYVFPLGVETKTALPINAVIAPFIGATLKLTPANPTKMFRTLAESTCYQLPASAKSTIAFCGNLARRLPIYDFEMGPNILDNAAYLQAFLKGIRTND